MPTKPLSSTPSHTAAELEKRIATLEVTVGGLVELATALHNSVTTCSECLRTMTTAFHTREIVLTDAQGRQRLILSPDVDGHAAIGLLNRAGKLSALLTEDHAGGVLRINTQEGGPAAELDTLGCGRLSLWDTPARRLTVTTPGQLP